ncbi:MAG: hypothetical protein HYX76_15360 [Acidobacteria bacterium]|nr:hypothetical protein [Acidobacteriota bacterium]
MRVLMIAILMLGGSPADAADLGRLLPADASVAPWQAQGPPSRYDASTLSRFIDGGAEVYLQFGFARAVSQEYVLADESVVCTIYEMTDVEAAFGVFSYFRTPGKTPLPIGDGAFVTDLQLLLRQDRYFAIIETYGSTARADAAMRLIAAQVSEQIGRKSGEPTMLARLGRDRRVPFSEKLLKGRLAAEALFETLGAEIIQPAPADTLLVASYVASIGSIRVFVLVCDDGRRAAQSWHSIPGALEKAGYRDVEARDNERAWAKNGSTLLVRRSDATLTFVIGAASVSEARTLLDGTAS